MIRIASQPKSAAPVWHEAFMSLLPKICYYARFAFRHLDPEARQEAIQNVVAAALNAYVRLVQLGKADIAYATPLAKYAIRQHNDGRRLGCRLNVRDVSSEYAQKMKSFCLQKLDHYDETEGVWEEILIEDKTVGPAELAATRIDFPAWLDTLKPRNRRIALTLAAGESTGRVARMFRLSEGRISQVRRELQKAWETFTDESDSHVPAAVPA
jgi:hypothetical protein